ncbi:phytase [Arthrobacter pascens]|uniref:phytase n=1 Tax=Arthrobacter pascens TaxID=1677 RepID=UPI00196BAFB0|nr:phytase [Arthrobacter pascens]MBN3498320.1 phytase [Arthrobacter pascens]
MATTRTRTSVAALLALAVVAVVALLGGPGTAVAAPTTVILNAAADTYLSTSSPNSNFGSATSLTVSQNSNRVLVRFNVSLPEGSSITNVVLRVYSRISKNGNLIVHPASNDWGETTVTSANQPPWQDMELSRSGVLRSGQYISATLPASSVPSSGSVSFGLNTTPGIQGSLASREASQRPQLVITYDSPPQPTIPTVLPVVETVGFSGSGDTSDDSAIWIDPENPANSVVVADKKVPSGGGIGVFGMDGSLIQFRGDGNIGNVDLRTGFPSSGASMVLVGANNRTNNTLALYSLDTVTRTLSPVAARSISTFAPNYGFCLYHSKLSGKFYAFVTPFVSGTIQQFELFDNGAGQVDAALVRTLPIGSSTEGCVADDDLGHLYVGEEDVALWKYGAEPDTGETRVSVDTAGGGRLVADIEGMSIEYGPNGTGRLFVSSQGDSTIAVYDRAGGNAFLTKFSLGANGTIDAVTGSDGVDVTPLNAGPQFEQGLLVVHDDTNSGGTSSNLKYVPLKDVPATAPPPGGTAPVASFTASPTSGTVPLAVNFTDTSTGGPTAWAWEFGDGETATVQNPSHTYTAAGTYTARLTATNAAGSTSSTRTITVDPPGGTAPVASFTASPTSGTVPLAVSFTDTSTGNPTSWAWEFGDGETATVQNPSHTYATAGTYTARLTATNAAGSTSSTRTITVDPPGGTAPVASFTASPTSGTVPLAVNFTDTSTGNPTSWAWEFGDGGTATAQNPSHTYTSAGSYTARLTATNAAGSTSSTRTITVDPGGGTSPGIAMRSFRTASTETVTTTVALPAPAGRAAGDVLVASFTADKNPTAAVPAGWTAITNGLSIGSGARAFAYYRVAGASDPATYTWTLSTAVKWGGGITAYTGVNTSTPLDSTVATAVNATFSATSIAVPSVTTTRNGALLIGGFGFDSSSPAATPPAGWTERWETSGGQVAQQADRTQPTAGSSGTATWTFSSAKAVAAWRTALKPAG